MSADSAAGFLTPAEVSERYRGKITTGTLANWRCNGDGPPFTKTGGVILYPLVDLLEWEKNRTYRQTSEYGCKV